MPYIYGMTLFTEFLDGNPFLKDEYKSNFMPDKEVIDFLEALYNGELVESVDLDLLKRYNNGGYFWFTKRKIGMVSPTMEWARKMKELVGDKRVLEVGAGTGLVAKFLSEAGIDIIATDNMNWHKNFDWKLYFDVKEMDYLDAIREYKADYLLICWALLWDEFDVKATELFKEINPDGLVICIGEVGGCTGSEVFFEKVEIVDCLHDINKVYPRWDGLYDRVLLVKTC